MEVKPDKKLIQRLNRVEGQIGGIKRMVESESTCQDVIAQVNAARSALDRIAGYIVAKNLEQCLLEYEADEREEAIEQAVNLLIKTKR
ncbi:MAG: metal-sensing transcriptional repressor [Culicoidibacterales bacterium]